MYQQFVKPLSAYEVRRHSASLLRDCQIHRVLTLLQVNLSGEVRRGIERKLHPLLVRGSARFLLLTLSVRGFQHPGATPAAAAGVASTQHLSADAALSTARHPDPPSPLAAGESKARTLAPAVSAAAATTARSSGRGDVESAALVHAFDDAWTEVRDLMQKDSWPRYLQSATFQQLLKSVG